MDKKMNLIELTEALKQKTKGTYMAVDFSADTVKRLRKFMKDHDIPNRVPKEKYHTTVIYSRKYLPDVKALGKIDPPWIGKPVKLDIFTSKEGNNCLVLLFSCKELVKRHEQIMDEHKATYDFPEYHAHITMSYNCGDFDPKSIKDFSSIGDIEIVNEYAEDLNLDWAKTEGSE
jgi:2'-5' RNA ligase